MTTLKIIASIDAFTSERRSKYNYGGPAKLWVQDGTGSPAARVFLWFSLTRVPRDANITSARLLVAQYGAVPGSPTLACRACVEDWRARTITHDNSPAVGPLLDSDDIGGPDRTTAEFDVLSVIQDIRDGSIDNDGFRIASSDSTRRFLRGINAPGPRPQLILTYTTLPLTPTGLTPAGGVLSTRYPVLQANVGNDAVSARWQISTDPTFGSFVYDTGDIPTTGSAAEHATAGTSFPGLPIDGTPWYWRVSSRNTVGPSTPAPGALIGYRALTPPVIVSPTPGVIGDGTPPTLWTDADQVASRVQFTDTTTGTSLWDSEEESGDTYTATPTTGLTVLGQAGTIAVSTLDGTDRIESIGAPAWATTTVDVVLGDTTTVEPVQSLSVRQVDHGAPWLQIRATRDEIPDAWVLQRDGVDVARYDGTDLLDVAGAPHTFEVIDYTTPAQDPWNITLVPIVNDQRAANNPVSTVAVEIRGVWLVDVDTGREVVLLGRDEVDAEQKSENVVFEKWGTTDDGAVVYTYHLGGITGSYAGELGSYYGHQAAELAATMQAFRTESADGSAKIRAAWGSTNIPVALRAVTVSPIRAGSGPRRARRTARFTFDQRPGD